MVETSEPLDKLDDIESPQPRLVADEAPQAPDAPEGEWDRYFKGMLDGLKEQQARYFERVKELSTNEEFTLKFVKESPKYEIVERTFQRRKVTVTTWNMVEEIRAQLTKLKDREQIVAKMAEIYYILAHAYFGISKEDYGNADWDTIKLAVDACNYRTQYGIPF
jgi:hypothetical protein